MLGTLSTAPGHPVTPRDGGHRVDAPAHRRQRQRLGTDSRQAMSAQGMIQKPVIGTASASEID
jgi:hypothetical protein